MARNLEVLIRSFTLDRDPLARCHSIDDLRELARRRVPRPVFDYVDGGAEDEVTLRRNRAAFDDYTLVPEAFVDVERVSMATTVLDTPMAAPIVLAPTGFTKLTHREGEAAAARAAADAGLVYSLSSVSTMSIEDVAAAAPGSPKWFQVYMWKTRAVVEDCIERAHAAGYTALLLTVDVPVIGRRRRDLYNGMTIPPRVTPRGLLDGARRPSWWWNFLLDREIVFANVDPSKLTLEPHMTLNEQVEREFDPGVQLDVVSWLKERFPGPVAVKGVMTAEQARRCVDAGADGVLVSNHGGRQLDHAPGTLDALPAVVDAVGDRAEVLVDGGVRRGSDVVKALALGARAVLVGRPYLYGLGAGGQRGVARAIELLLAELHTTLQLVGVTDVTKVSREVLAPRRA